MWQAVKDIFSDTRKRWHDRMDQPLVRKVPKPLTIDEQLARLKTFYRSQGFDGPPPLRKYKSSSGTVLPSPGDPDFTRQCSHMQLVIDATLRDMESGHFGISGYDRPAPVKSVVCLWDRLMADNHYAGVKSEFNQELVDLLCDLEEGSGCLLSQEDEMKLRTEYYRKRWRDYADGMHRKVSLQGSGLAWDAIPQLMGVATGYGNDPYGDEYTTFGKPKRDPFACLTPDMSPRTIPKRGYGLFDDDPVDEDCDDCMNDESDDDSSMKDDSNDDNNVHQTNHRVMEREDVDGLNGANAGVDFDPRMPGRFPSTGIRSLNDSASQPLPRMWSEVDDDVPSLNLPSPAHSRPFQPTHQPKGKVLPVLDGNKPYEKTKIDDGNNDDDFKFLGAAARSASRARANATAALPADGSSVVAREALRAQLLLHVQMKLCARRSYVRAGPIDWIEQDCSAGASAW